MREQLDKLEYFQKAFGATVNTKPTLIDKESALLRVKLLEEEVQEMKEAIENDDLVELLDAITDIRFLNTGDYVVFGLQEIGEKAFEEVFQSNLSKLDSNGLPIINGENGVFDATRPLKKILKSQNYFAPNLKQFLNEVL